MDNTTDKCNMEQRQRVSDLHPSNRWDTQISSNRFSWVKRDYWLLSKVLGSPVDLRLTSSRVL